MIKKIALFIAFLIALNSTAQKNNTSAYSFFGVGDNVTSSTVEQMSMGGIGVNFADNFHLSFTNPASFASLRVTTYSLAVQSNRLTAMDADNKQKATANYLSYVALGVPLGQHGGLSFGLLPNTLVGYSLRSNVMDSENEVIEATIYNGEGGTNKVYLGVGYSIFKGLKLGIQGEYIFGNIENGIINQRKNVILPTKHQTISNVKGFALKGGLQYRTKLKGAINLSLGAAFELENELEADGNEYLYSVSISTFESPRDTTLNRASSGTLTLPLKTSVGVGVGEDSKWFAGVDYSFRDAVAVTGNVFNNFNKVAYDSSSKISLGGFYIPKWNSINNYWERVTYRAGVKKEKTGLMVDASGNGNDFTAVDDFGISFGVGLPIGKRLSNLNMGFEIGKRGTTSKGLVKENYVNFSLSLSLNDQWFIKREIF